MNCKIVFINEEEDVIGDGFLSREDPKQPLNPAEVEDLKVSLTETLDAAETEEDRAYILSILESLNAHKYEVWTDAEGDEAELLYKPPSTICTVEQAAPTAAAEEVSTGLNLDKLLGAAKRKAEIEEQLDQLLTERAELEKQKTDIEAAITSNSERIKTLTKEAEELNSSDAAETIKSSVIALSEQLAQLQALAKAMNIQL